MGHEAIGIVEAVGSDVRTLTVGNVVVMPFASSDGTCTFCQEGLHTACVHVGFFGNGDDLDGAQAEALLCRVKRAAPSGCDYGQRVQPSGCFIQQKDGVRDAARRVRPTRWRSPPERWPPCSPAGLP
jgi:D-arabinose 1-dehydrogenase-like Zn-dependent alcohol dehydrogenase